MQKNAYNFYEQIIFIHIPMSINPPQHQDKTPHLLCLQKLANTHTLR